MLESDMAHAYLTESNRGMTATDTQKNTVYYVAKQMKEPCSPEEYALALASHFVKEYPLVSKAKVLVKVAPWQRYTSNDAGGSHNHGYVGGPSETRTAYVTVCKQGNVTVTAGVQGLKVLKTTQSGYSGFLHDKYTVLSDTNERILATSMKCSWKYCSKNLPFDYDAAFEQVKATCLSTFFGPAQSGVFSPSVQYTLYQMGKDVIQRMPSVSSIYFNLPNLHFVPCNPVCSKFEDDIYVATSEPHGNIEAVITRKGLEAHCKL